MPLHRYAESFEYSIEVEINILRNDNVSFLEICCLRIGSQIESRSVFVTFYQAREFGIGVRNFWI